MVMRNDTDPWNPTSQGAALPAKSLLFSLSLPTDRPPAQRALGRHEVQIGRDVAPQRGIRIDSPRVSPLHATVIKPDSGYVLAGLGEHKRDFANLHKIDSHRFCPGMLSIAGTLFLIEKRFR